MDSREETKNETKTNGMLKKEEKARKRDIRTLENVLKKLSNLSESEKHEALKAKYKEIYDEHKNLQNQMELLTKKVKVQDKEFENMKVEYTKSTFVCNRLENVCRELQNQNKIFKEQNMTKIKENEEMHKKVVTKFEGALTELSAMLQDNNEDNLKLKNDNVYMIEKMTCLGQEFEKSQVEMNKMSEKMNLEKLLFEAKNNKLDFELKAEREKWATERKILGNNLMKSEENCSRLEEIVKTLGGNLDLYTSKYKEFQSSISKSHKVIYDCKSEMTRLSNQNAVLENEIDTWKSRLENKSKALSKLEVVKQKQDLELGSCERKLEQLQKLCRQLQVDRAAYLKLLKANGIEPTTQICVDASQPAAAPPKPTKKELELQMLKSNLKLLKEQFSGITGKNYAENADSESKKQDPSSQSVNNSEADSSEQQKIQIEENKAKVDSSVHKTEENDSVVSTTACNIEQQNNGKIEEIGSESGNNSTDKTEDKEEPASNEKKQNDLQPEELKDDISTDKVEEKPKPVDNNVAIPDV